MRSKKTIINTCASLLSEIISIVCSFILPRLILSNFGSVYNGLTTSISQFLACAVLLRSGIGGATRAALYKPLADNNKNDISSIIKATDIFMKKIGLILAVLIFVFACIYPLFVKSEFDWLFSFSLFVIIGLSTFAESFWGITYLILLQADQKLYISSIISIICNILNIVIASILIINHFSIHIVKLGSALVFVLNPLLLNIYVKRKYRIDKTVKPNNKAIEQRWDSFWHQVAVFINSNTDVMVLTIFSNMLEVSVYSVYHMITHGLERFVNSFTNSIEAAFGNMLAKNEKKALNDNLLVFECIVYNLSSFMFSCALVLSVQFVMIYTKGISDANYYRPMFIYILLFGQFISSIRLPYLYIINAAGHFKQTKKYAIIEALLNISISISLVVRFGLIGVAIGTFLAMTYKTIMFSNYMSKKIVCRSILITYKKILISLCEIIIIILLSHYIGLTVQYDYFSFFFNGICTAIIALIVISIGILLFYRNDFKQLLIKIKNMRKNTKTKKTNIVLEQ